MARVRVYHDKQGNTLSVWFGDPQQEHVCEETGEGVVLMKDRDGHVIGFEKLEFAIGDPTPLEVGFDTVGV
jgi:hypothetical protein